MAEAVDRLTGTTTRSAWRALATAAVAAAVVSPSPVPVLRTYAATPTPTTPERLDIRTTSLALSDGQLIAKITTHDRLRARHFQGGEAFLIKLDTRGGPRADFTLRLDYYEGAYPYCACMTKAGSHVRAGAPRRGAAPSRAPCPSRGSRRRATSAGRWWPPPAPPLTWRPTAAGTSTESKSEGRGSPPTCTTRGPAGNSLGGNGPRSIYGLPSSPGSSRRRTNA